MIKNEGLIGSGIVVKQDMVFVEKNTVSIAATPEPVDLSVLVSDIDEEELAEIDRLGEMEMISQLVQAEAGNQDLTGMRYVVDVVLNRVDSDQFPNTVEEVIFQSGQFSVIKNGAYDKAGWNISDAAFEAVRLEYEGRLNYDILYFSRGKSPYASHHFKHQDHWFGW